MKNVLRLKRNETFYIREGWLEKGINIIKNNAKCFSNNSGPSIFGLGSNMCKSLRYWLEACNIATFGQNGAFKCGRLRDDLTESFCGVGIIVGDEREYLFPAAIHCVAQQ